MTPLLLAAFLTQAPKWDLVLVIYASDTGHQLNIGSYMASFHVGGFESEKACERAGKISLTTYKSQVLPDGARILPGFMCEKQP
jgi:hypothetical protein